MDKEKMLRFVVMFFGISLAIVHMKLVSLERRVDLLQTGYIKLQNSYTQTSKVYNDYFEVIHDYVMKH